MTTDARIQDLLARLRRYGPEGVLREMKQIGAPMAPHLAEIVTALANGEPDRRLRDSVFRILLELGPVAKGAAPALRRALDAPDKELRHLAEKALRGLGEAVEIRPRRALPGPLTAPPDVRGAFRRPRYAVTQLEGCTPEEIRAVLGPDPEENEGKFWASPENGTHYRCAYPGAPLTETEAMGPVPILEPGRPYVYWLYGNVIPPGHPLPEPGEELSHASQTWWIYFLTEGDAAARRPTVVFATDAYPTNVDF
jgi:hypothetical protein